MKTILLGFICHYILWVNLFWIFHLSDMSSQTYEFKSKDVVCTLARDTGFCLHDVQINRSWLRIVLYSRYKVTTTGVHD